MAPTPDTPATVTEVDCHVHGLRGGKVHIRLTAPSGPKFDGSLAWIDAVVLATRVMTAAQLSARAAGADLTTIDTVARSARAAAWAEIGL